MEHLIPFKLLLDGQFESKPGADLLDKKRTTVRQLTLTFFGTNVKSFIPFSVFDRTNINNKKQKKTKTTTGRERRSKTLKF